MEKHIYFVRHGQSEENVDHVYRGKDARLTEKGKEQAAYVAERIARIGVEALLTSPFERALDTANAIGKAINIKPESNMLFAEWMEPSVVNGLHRDHPERKSVYETIHDALDPHFKHGDEESFSQLVTRAKAATQALEEHPAKRICVVTHGGFLKILIGSMAFGQIFDKSIFRQMLLTMPTTNTGVTYAQITEMHPRWRLITWNDQSHLG